MTNSLAESQLPWYHSPCHPIQDQLGNKLSGNVVVDDTEAVLSESADIADNIKNGNLSREHLLPLSALVDGKALPKISGKRDLLVLKTVGTALQDLAMARAVYRDPAMQARANDIGNVLTLKGFANKAVTLTA